MNFETAFAHYQAHTATAEETALVERELEKYRLIEDYLAEQELPELPEDAAAAASAETKAVKRRLNRRTRNIVLISTAAVLAVVLLLQLVVSPLLNQRVYTDDLVDGSGYPTFDVGMSALAGLYMPLGDYYGGYAEHSGFMRDTLRLMFYDRTGSNRFHIQTQVGLSLGHVGQLNSGDLHAIGYMYSGFFYDNRNSSHNYVWSGDTGQAALDALPEYMRLTSAVSLNKVLTVDELADIMARHPDVDFLSANVWVDGAYNYDTLHCSLQHMMLVYGDDLEEDYPGLQLREYKNLTGEDITQHFRAMVQYLADHPEVAKAGPDEPYRYKEMLLNLEEDGLEVLGLWVQGTPDQITALLDEELVRSVWNYDARIQLWT